ncbi:MAG TPA: TlpA disulfide reductase family protein [Ktedonobacterales bacterium]|nr:TlpA disulfide reductase family protein [Ktedonobacterales bacterium]
MPAKTTTPDKKAPVGAQLYSRWRAILTPTGALRAGVIAAALVALSLALLVRPLAGPANGPQRLVGHPAPSFTLPVAQDGRLAPAPQTLFARQSYPTLLVFFNTLCVHCLSEMQITHSIASAHSSLAVVYIDAPGENAEIVANYLIRLQFDAPVLLDANEAIASHYGVRYYPTLFLVDSRGIVRAAWSGETPASTLEEALARNGG